ncbi:hypothetical protein ACFFRR_009610 [Megaselia abdita]
MHPTLHPINHPSREFFFRARNELVIIDSTNRVQKEFDLSSNFCFGEVKKNSVGIQLFGLGFEELESNSIFLTRFRRTQFELNFPIRLGRTRIELDLNTDFLIRFGRTRIEFDLNSDFLYVFITIIS